VLNVGRVVPVISRLDWNAQQVFEDVNPLTREFVVAFLSPVSMTPRT
jgi:hypothetical protein